MLHFFVIPMIYYLLSKLLGAGGNIRGVACESLSWHIFYYVSGPNLRLFRYGFFISGAPSFSIRSEVSLCSVVILTLQGLNYKTLRIENSQCDIMWIFLEDFEHVF